MTKTLHMKALAADMSRPSADAARRRTGFPTYGHAIGVIMLNCRFPRPPGDMGNASTFDFPVLYHVVDDVDVGKLLTCRTDRYIAPFLKAARDLESRGVKAITTSCGCLALHQHRLASVVEVPLFASTLIQVPLVYEMLGRRGKIGILAADEELLSDEHYQAVGWSTRDIPIALASMSEAVEFPKMMEQNGEAHLSVDFSRVEIEVRDAVRKLTLREPDTRAIVVECTNLVPYAAAIQEESGVPVFDIVTLTRMVHDTVVRRRFTGHF